MDDRLTFLYCRVPELRGHGGERGAGKGNTGPNRIGASQENPGGSSRGCDGERNISSEARGSAVKKSRYSTPCTRTVNRHR